MNSSKTTVVHNRSKIVNYKPSKPKVTLGVCVRNSEDDIQATIQGIVNQDYAHNLMEIIFVDDGSRDNTLSIIERNVPLIDIQTKVFSDAWHGLGKTRNVVVDNANGDYIIWVDGDTVLPGDYVRTHVNFMEMNPKVGVAGGTFSIRDDKCLVAFLEHSGFEAVNVKHGGHSISKLPGTAGATYRVNAIRQVNGFDDCITGAGEDTDAAYRIRETGWLIYIGIGGKCYTKRKETWAALWKQYLWHGYGYHYIYHKNKRIGKLWDMSPPIAVISGLLNSITAYKITHRKTVFLLPIQFVFKLNAWWLGFIKSHLRSYGHMPDCL